MSLQYMYRIEHRVTGVGPYQGNSGIKHSTFIKGLEQHPTMLFDVCVKGIEDVEAMYCAFRDIKSFMSWFDYDYLQAIIHAQVYHLTIWEVSQCEHRHGSKQSIFEKEKAMLVGTMELHYLLPLYEGATL